ncbi:hypothetical protein CMQ_7090 [Grosmannia clavigera kw1407]|uniref:Uncharacterized protein n=1 Tax=Grosmannia clavigera (strain kw1407 / UAMH 11150) TaxID=655863 RepID=F0XPL9_GROCL|nr:uncharacterized protein CMQ_7090 [Grosmannia clavigera kw1407]EFX00088.1 hypothetical protein CMQ_7090 [Grosmannia clavigera kw1407]
MATGPASRLLAYVFWQMRNNGLTGTITRYYDLPGFAPVQDAYFFVQTSTQRLCVIFKDTLRVLGQKPNRHLLDHPAHPAVVLERQFQQVVLLNRCGEEKPIFETRFDPDSNNLATILQGPKLVEREV